MSVVRMPRPWFGVAFMLVLYGCASGGPTAGVPVEHRGSAAAAGAAPGAPVAPRDVSSGPAPLPAPLPSPGARPPMPQPPPNAPVGPASRGAGSTAVMSLASQALLAQSRHEVGVGNLSAAADDLERALRIDPLQPLLWLELGELRLAAGDRGQAEMMAHRALSLGGRDPAIQARVEDLLVRAGR